VLNFDEVCGGTGVSASATKLENAIESAVAAVTGVRCRMGFSFHFIFARRDFQIRIVPDGEHYFSPFYTVRKALEGLARCTCYSSEWDGSRNGNSSLIARVVRSTSYQGVKFT
jgi:hypothetical protein